MMYMGKLDSFVDRIRAVEAELGDGPLDRHVVRLKVIKGQVLAAQAEAARKKKRDDAHFVELASLDDLVRTLDRMIGQLEVQLLDPPAPRGPASPASPARSSAAGQGPGQGPGQGAEKSAEERAEERAEESAEESAYANDRPFDSVEPTLIVFYSERCGHCHRFRPVWAELKRVYKDRSLNMLAVRGDGASAEVMGLMRQFGVTGYPTVVLIEPRANRKVEFEDERTLSNLVHFVESNLP